MWVQRRAPNQLIPRHPNKPGSNELSADSPATLISISILFTGAAVFIGAATAQALLDAGHQIVGIDDVNDYYETSLKDARIARLGTCSNFRFEQANLADRAAIERIFRDVKFARVAHLGAQSGVRHSIDQPLSYVESNLLGTAHVLEGCRHHDVEHLVYASTSSVYGLHTDLPYSTAASASHPMSFYSATKRSTELMAQFYSHLFRLPTTGLRFFTIYGPMKAIRLPGTEPQPC